jgi:hypothetical protein
MRVWLTADTLLLWREAGRVWANWVRQGGLQVQSRWRKIHLGSQAGYECFGSLQCILFRVRGLSQCTD